MRLYAVQNYEGKWLGCEVYCDEPDWFDHGGFMWNILSVAEENMKLYGGHVVELIEAPAKVVVSEEEAEMLEQTKCDDDPAELIVGFVNSNDKYDDDSKAEDRLMRAYVIGWTVEKPKHYVLPMEGTELADGTVAYAALDHTGAWTVKGYAEEQSAITFGSTVTQSDIDAAPDWVKAITPVEVTDDEQ